MFKKILIANRGEIALRVIRACAEMGIRSVAVFSEPDRDSLHVKLADESYCIGPAAPKQSYLSIPSIISVAEVAGVDAIHPGYGFLSENSRFAEVCRAHNITFIGPPPEVMEKVGDKATAREIAMKARVPVIPGSTGTVGTVEDVQALGSKFGYPILIKATAGGGGKGMRGVANPEEAAAAFRMAQIEAQSAFGVGDVYVEKMILEPRHVEIQILADKFGNIVYLGERECSVQRRHQKLLEEAPSVVLDDRLRREMGEAGVRVAKASGYQNAGTVEFLLDKDRKYYFIEMNARLQVEHPVTEMITGIDIVKEQIHIAAGEHMTLRQRDIVIRGHAIECRINAEDPARDFMPSPGDIDIYLAPGGPNVRVDSHLYPGYKVLPNYDSLLSKLIVWGTTRDEAIARMLRCLNEYVISGVATTIPFHQKLLTIEAFRTGDLSTHFIEKHMNHQPPAAISGADG